MLHPGEGWFRFGDVNFVYLRQAGEGKLCLMLHPDRTFFFILSPRFDELIFVIDMYNVRCMLQSLVYIKFY